MRNTEKALLERIRGVAEVCRQEGVPCLANGDVENYQDALRVMKEYQVDGAMIARFAELNPSCFRRDGKLPSIDIARQFLERVCIIWLCVLMGRLLKWIITSQTRNTALLDYSQIGGKNPFINKSPEQRQ
jgi:tRNA-dihydrouridine synthase